MRDGRQFTRWETRTYQNVNQPTGYCPQMTEKKTGKDQERSATERRNRIDRRSAEKRIDERRLLGYGEVIPDRRLKNRRGIKRRHLTKRRLRRRRNA